MNTTTYKCSKCDYQFHGPNADEESIKVLVAHIKEKHQMSKLDEEQFQEHYNKEAKRSPIAVRYDLLDNEFQEMMARLAAYGAKKYGESNYQQSRLTGDKSPINHIRDHITKYIDNRPYDHIELTDERKGHLVAIAFNAMMEYWYECHPEVK